MVFSSVVFLFFFLPCSIVGYYCIFNRSITYKNYWLLACSLLFYAWGGSIAHLALMLFSITVDWLFARIIDSDKENTGFRKAALIGALVMNLGVLFVFKYLNFTVDSVNAVCRTRIQIPLISLPIGISFFTFQGMSYVNDVYRKRAEVLKDWRDVGLYVSMFPQLIAGPIVRYETVALQMRSRKETADQFCRGISRFIVGLGKKVLLANTVAIIAKQAFDGKYMESAAFAWLGVLAYTFQIYYDFSGYSDMAIGLGKMFGFEYEENFSYPYISRSITEFWRRWHISMGTWFRDYLYIPLGGSRVSVKRSYLNLFIVWLCTGIWHGANWTFLIWGMIHFVIICLERITGLNRNQERNVVFRILGHIYTLIAVMIGWVFFNSPSVIQAWDYLGMMFNLSGPLADSEFFIMITEYKVVLMLSALMCFPIKRFFQRNDADESQMNWVRVLMLLLVFFASVVYMVKGTYNPFIYFNF